MASALTQSEIFIALVVAAHAGVLAVRLCVSLYRACSFQGASCPLGIARPLRYKRAFDSSLWPLLRLMLLPDAVPVALSRCRCCQRAAL